MPDIDNYSRSDFEKVKESCKNAKNDIVEHFAAGGKMIVIGNEAKRRIERHFINFWFEKTTECTEDTENYYNSVISASSVVDYPYTSHLSEEIKKSQFLSAYPSDQEKFKSIGIDNHKDYAIFQNKGYQGLYNGLGVKDIHKRKGLDKNQKILDHMGSTELAANLFRATQTDDKLRRENIRGKENANMTHFVVGKKVRQTIKELGGTMPEDLELPEKSIQEIEEKHKKRLLQGELE